MPDVTDVTTPPEVVAATRQYGLGNVLAVRKGTHPLLAALASFAAAAVLAGVMWAVSELGEHIGFRSGQKAVGFLGLFACVFMVGFLVYGVVALIRGNLSYYVCTHGFVYRRNRTIRTYRWQEITELRSRLYEAGDNAGKIRDYQLVPANGKPITVPLEVVDDRDPFVDALITGLKREGRPVV